MKSISRRKFVAGALVVGGSAALAGCTTQSNSEPAASGTAEAAEYDVVVLGGRLAGLGAAGAAAQGGLNVALVEKDPTLPMSVSVSPSNLAIAQLPENEADWVFASDVPDTKEAFQQRWKQTTDIGKLNDQYPSYDRMTNIMMECSRTTLWMESIGCDFEKSGDKSAGQTDGVVPVLPAGSEVTGGQMIGNAIESLLNELGTTVLLDSPGVELVFDGERVTGAVIEGPEGRKTLTAKAVVLATGGFGASPEYREQLIPGVEALGSRSNALPLNTGDGITMATAVGGALYEDSWIIPKALVVSQKLLEADAELDTVKAQRSGMYVDKTGNRFMDEASGMSAYSEEMPMDALRVNIANDQAIVTTMVDLGQGPYYGLFDSSNTETAALIERGLATGDAFKGETIEELAAAAGMSSLVEAFTTYQAASASGNDAEFGKPAERMAAYAESGPYYLVHFVPSYVATVGGVITNDEYQVMNTEGNPIEGLYAIGEITHRFMYNRSYIAWASNGGSLTMGRLLGEQLVQEL